MNQIKLHCENVNLISPTLFFYLLIASLSLVVIISLIFLSVLIQQFKAQTLFALRDGYHTQKIAY